MVGVPVSTVRGWLRRFAANAEAVRVWFTVMAHDLGPLLAPILPSAGGVAAAGGARAGGGPGGGVGGGRGGPGGGASVASRGRLLSNTGCPWAAAG